MSVGIKKLTQLIRQNYWFDMLECKRALFSAEWTKPWLYEVRVHALRSSDGILVGFHVKPLGRWCVAYWRQDAVWGAIVDALDNASLVEFFAFGSLYTAALESPGAFMKAWMDGV